MRTFVSGVIITLVISILVSLEFMLYGIETSVSLIIGFCLVFGCELLYVCISLIIKKEKQRKRSVEIINKKDKEKTDISSLLESLKLDQEFGKLFDSVQCNNTSLIIKELNLPELERFENSIFFVYYQDFYSSKEGLIALKLIEQRWNSDTPLIHPKMQQLLLDFDIMSNDDNVIAEYPWLLPL